MKTTKKAALAAAFVLGLASSVAQAETAALPGPGHPLVWSELSTVTEIDRYTIPLRKGGHYAIGASAGRIARFTVRSPKGRVVASFLAGTETEKGKELQPEVSGLYGIEVKAERILEPQSYTLRVIETCLGGKGTRCSLKPGASFSGEMAFNGDFDAVRLATKTGQRYALTVDGGGVVLEVLDARLRRIAGTRGGYLHEPTTYTFTAPAGAVFARVIEQDDSGGPYKLSLRTN